MSDDLTTPDELADVIPFPAPDPMLEPAKHTPGPWQWSLAMGYPTDTLVGATGRTVLEAYESHGGGQFADEHDRLLIAAAPDLLEACEDLIGMCCALLDHENDPRVQTSLGGALMAVDRAKGIER